MVKMPWKQGSRDEKRCHHNHTILIACKKKSFLVCPQLSPFSPFLFWQRPTISLTYIEVTTGLIHVMKSLLRLNKQKESVQQQGFLWETISILKLLFSLLAHHMLDVAQGRRGHGRQPIMRSVSTEAEPLLDRDVSFKSPLMIATFAELQAYWQSSVVKRTFCQKVITG